MTIDQNRIVFDEFKGLYLRRNSSIVPKGYLKEANNVVIDDGSLRTRNGLSSYADLTAALGANSIKKIVCVDDVNVAANSNGAVLFILAGNNLYRYDGTTLTNLVTTILASASDMFVERFFDSYFITVTQMTNTPTTLSNIYVYPSTGSVRTALGTACPATALIVADDAAGTKFISAGYHIWGVAFGTDSGHITKVALGSLVAHNHPGGQRADLTFIRTGGAGTGTTKRYILVSKAIKNYDGNALNYELFFLPNGTINDNTTTDLSNVEFYDTELVDSAEYLKDIQETQSAAFGFCQYAERMVYIGASVSGSTADVVLSDKGKPETVNYTTSVLDVNSGTGRDGGTVAAMEQDGNLVLFKKYGTFITRDNGDDPNTWPVTRVDNHGTWPNGLCRSYYNGLYPVRGNILVRTHKGLYAFRGQYADEPLTRNIDAYIGDLLNSNIGNASLFQWQTFVDPMEELIYVGVTAATGDLGQNVIIVGDYRDGLDPDAIKWTLFKFYFRGVAGSYITTMFTLPRMLLNASAATQAKLGGIGGGLVVAGDTDLYIIGRDNSTHVDDATKFAWSFETGEIQLSGSLDKDQYNVIKLLHDRYNNSLGLNAKVTLAGVSKDNIALLNGSTEQLLRFPINANAVRGTFRLETATTNPCHLEYLKQIVIYGVVKEPDKLTGI